MNSTLCFSSWCFQTQQRAVFSEKGLKKSGVIAQMYQKKLVNIAKHLAAKRPIIFLWSWRLNRAKKKNKYHACIHQATKNTSPNESCTHEPLFMKLACHMEVDNVLPSCFNKKMLQADNAEMLEIPGMCAFVIGVQWSIKAILSALRGFQGTLGREDHLDQMESQYVTHKNPHSRHTHLHELLHAHSHPWCLSAGNFCQWINRLALPSLLLFFVLFEVRSPPRDKR